MIVLPTWAVVTPQRVEHIDRVAALMGSWATALGLDSSQAARWQRAAIFHDALKDAGPERLARYAPQDGWHPKLWHGPAAAAAAAQHGERDPGVLSAVRYHSTGFAGWDGVGDALYLESMEHLAECGPSFENSDPGESRLKGFEGDLLEEALIAVKWISPLLVVIPHVLRVVAHPATSGKPVSASDEICHARCSIPSWSRSHAFVEIPLPAL